jgi:hypothetical protein
VDDEALARVGRVVPAGGAVTGLTVWGDVDPGVEAPGLTAAAAGEAVLPVLRRCSAPRYVDERADSLHCRVDGRKVDVSL